MNSSANKLEVKNSIEIHADLETVWDILVNPEKTKIYMFGCETVSNWNIGDSLMWRGEYEGKPMVFVSGYILEFEKNKKLKYSVIDPNAPYEKTPENHLDVTYELSFSNGTTTLTITQDGFENAADSEKRYQDVYNNGDGWNPILKEIKRVAESQ
jgi:uncharacterized protein YndB with AHSA1/START domain